MRTPDSSQNLWSLPAKPAATRTVAVLTSMAEPLGRFAGNWVEVWECVDIMKGTRHPLSHDLIELYHHAGRRMLYLRRSRQYAKNPASSSRPSASHGRCLEEMACMVEARAAPPASSEDPARLPQTRSNADHHRTQGRLSQRDGPAQTKNKSAGPFSD